MTKRIIAAILMLSLLLGCGAAAAEETAPMYELTAKYGFRLGAPLSFWNILPTAAPVFLVVLFLK